jgi:hypothetical protein
VKFTLAQAAIETGKDRSTLFRAIKKGKLSAEKQDDGSYLIDSSEIYRVYPQKQNDSANTQGAHDAKQQFAQGALVDALREQIELLKDQVDREREQADHWRNQATMLLTHQPPELPEKKPESEPDPEQPKSLLWQRLFGRGVPTQ